MVEDHHDDCGEVFGPLGEDFLVQHPFEVSGDLTSGSSGEECFFLAADFAQHDLARGGAMEFSDLESFIAWSSSQRRCFHDVAQLCGGAGDTAELLITRGYSGGPNFDILCGFNLLNPHTKYYDLKYLQECQPNILLISTPCTGMKGFSALNRAINYAGWLRTRRSQCPSGISQAWRRWSKCEVAGISLQSILRALIFGDCQCGELSLTSAVSPECWSTSAWQD